MPPHSASILCDDPGIPDLEGVNASFYVADTIAGEINIRVNGQQTGILAPTRVLDAIESSAGSLKSIGAESAECAAQLLLRCIV